MAAKYKQKNFTAAFEKVQKVWHDVEELDLGEKHRGQLTTAMTNLMLAQAVNQLRLDLVELFAKPQPPVVAEPAPTAPTEPVDQWPAEAYQGPEEFFGSPGVHQLGAEPCGEVTFTAGTGGDECSKQ